MSTPETINKSKTKIGNYPIKEIIQESISVVRPIARKYGVSFKNIIFAPDFQNITLRVDKGAFVMVFYNLLSNSIKYHGSDFEVILSAKDTPEGLYVSISDNGMGIDKKDISRIFLLGVRSKSIMKKNSDGYGVGLHVVKLILDSYSGSIQVSSNRDPTTFQILLPRKLYT